MITLTTDFGLRDSYSAQLKGAILCLSPSSQLIDISHQVPPFNIFHAAWLLKEAAPRFPDGCIHLAVVDPGVGTERLRIIIQAKLSTTDSGASKTAYFVGPDNGIFSLAIKRSSILAVWEIKNLDLLPPVDAFTTFDGRDVFAPVCALLDQGRSPDLFGERLSADSLQYLSVPKAKLLDDGSVVGEILYEDHFGNLITNIKSEDVGQGRMVKVWVGDCDTGSILSPILGQNQLKEFSIAPNYQSIEPGEQAAIVNSQGLLEIAQRGETQGGKIG